MTNKEFVQSERQFTVDLLKKLTPEQWQASTLCAGWTVEDLAAHLIVREGLIAPIGLVIPQLHKIHENRIEKMKAKGQAEIIRRLQRYPWYIPAVANTGEFYVHNEDLLRGGLQMTRPEPNKAAQAILWGSLSGLVKIKKGLVKDLGNVMIENSQTAEVLTIRNSKNQEDTTITGLASEVLMYFYGRRAAAKVKVFTKKI